MQCDFNIGLDGKHPDEVYAKIKQAISEHGKFTETGNRQLDFEIRIPLLKNIKGSLSVEETQLVAFITQKPNSISCQQIEDEIRKFLN